MCSESPRLSHGLRHLNYFHDAINLSYTGEEVKVARPQACDMKQHRDKQYSEDVTRFNNDILGAVHTRT